MAVSTPDAEEASEKLQAKFEKELGVKYHTFEETIKDTVHELLEIEKKVKA